MIIKRERLEDDINQLIRKMERFSHPCDRGEIVHLLAAKQRELAEIKEFLN